MRLVVVADSHLPAHRDLPAGLREALGRADAALHAGDVTSAAVYRRLAASLPTYGVLGNNDVELIGVLPERLELELAGARVAMVHDSGARTGREARLQRWFPTADLVVFGHSHLPLCTVSLAGQRLLNPGSPTQRRRAPTHTFAELDLEAGAVIDVRLVDLGP